MLYQRARFLDFMWNSMEYIIRVINAGLQSLFDNKKMGEKAKTGCQLTLTPLRKTT